MRGETEGDYWKVRVVVKMSEEKGKKTTRYNREMANKRFEGGGRRYYRVKPEHFKRLPGNQNVLQ